VKNTKNSLFVVTAALAAGLLAALCSGCDGSGGGDEVASSGDAGRPDADLPAKSDAGGGGPKATPCQVPTPRLAMSGVGSTPRLGYVVLASEAALTCTADPRYQLEPAACNAPADGFAGSSSDPWCCVDVKSSGTSLADARYPLKCLSGVNTVPGSESDVPGDVAVCGASGVFLGWACQGASLSPVLASRTVPATTCPVPAPKRKISGADHPPTAGYKRLVGTYGAVPCSTAVDYLSGAPTDCSDPVGGFESTSAPASIFCCVKTVANYGNDPGKATFSSLSCGNSFSAGNVALCTEDGIFAGWEC
jgi:hypothetical protein